MRAKKKTGHPHRKPAISPGHPEPLEFEAVGENPDWSCDFGHLTVMGPEAIEALDIKPCGVYLDATLGGGGHSRLILQALGSEGRLISVDQDPEPRKWALEGWGKGEERLTVAAGNFGDVAEIVRASGVNGLDGIVADLGLSSRQLLASGRGFSWTADEPLDMRLDPEGDLKAWDVVNRYPEKELADLIWRYGEERASRRIARGLVWAREKKPIETSGELAALVSKSLFRPGPPPRIHPATRTFMAIRIAVNRELEVLENLVRGAAEVLKPGGRLVVISFHSLEDRIIKESFRDQTQNDEKVWDALFKKPQEPSEAEVERNPRARSAKMRAAVKR